MQATPIAAVLIAACLSGCGGLKTGIDLNSTASVDSSGKSAGPKRTGDAPLLAMTDDTATKPGSAAAQSPRPLSALGNSLSARAAVETKPLDPAPTPTPVAAKSGELAKPVEASLRTDPRVNQPRGRAYLFRGVAGLTASMA